MRAHGMLTEDSLSLHGTITSGSGREGKGREGKRNRVPHLSFIRRLGDAPDPAPLTSARGWNE